LREFHKIVIRFYKGKPLHTQAAQFEGPEKKLEIILFSPQPGLRDNSDRRWERVVKAGRAEIISKKSNNYLDAYILSESSLFVWEDRILMITCGQTNLINAVPEILKIADKQKVAMVFYERKNFMFPQMQPADFEDDVAGIQRHFAGKSYRLGPANHDHVHVFYSSHAKTAASQDATLQVLMHDLGPSIYEICIKGNSRSADQVLVKSGLNRIFPQMDMDSHVFYPYGFSVNGIERVNYFTVHITPQPEGSYASFETNVIKNDYSGTVADVLSVFRPKRFSLLLTTSMDAQCLQLHSTVNAAAGYNVTEKSFYEFDCGYAVTFLNYDMMNS
jgi:S-adenosylmethionine decarboxylase